VIDMAPDSAGFGAACRPDNRPDMGTMTHDADLLGVDFTSRPMPRKPIIVAHGVHAGAAVRLLRIDRHVTLDSYARWLAAPGPWIGAFDHPFGLSRALVEALGWPTDWLALMRHYAALSRDEVRATFAAWCASRPAGGKFAHRACERPAGASPSMKWVNPPVALMLHAGMPLLIDAGVHLPTLHAGDPARVALEGYPGMLARAVLGARSYKSDERARQTPERLIARKDLVDALEQGRLPFGLRLKLTHARRELLVDDATGDSIDAVLCLLQAAWAATQPRYGLPERVDPLEGWIVGAPGEGGS
jgi:hypothetical protein